MHTDYNTFSSVSRIIRISDPYVITGSINVQYSWVFKFDKCNLVFNSFVNPCVIKTANTTSVFVHCQKNREKGVLYVALAYDKIDRDNFVLGRQRSNIRYYIIIIIAYNVQ